MISVIDIEASGFGAESYPIEVGVVTSTNVRLCALIHPFSDWQHWNVEAEAIHGISRETLFANGVQPRGLCLQMNDLLGGTAIYSDAWVHDNDWLNKLFYRSRVEKMFRVSPIESAVTEEQLMIWDYTKQIVIKKLGLARHRASSDALVIQKTFELTRKQCVNKPLKNCS